MADYTDPGTSQKEDPQEDRTGRSEKSTRWATVALSVGLSSLASAVVIGVGAAVMFANADNGQVTVISGDAANAAGVTSKKGANSTTAKRTTSAAATTSRAAGAAGSAGGTGASSGSTGGEPARINGGGVPAPVDDTGSGDGSADTADAAGAEAGVFDDGASDIPPQPSNAELKSQLDSILAADASDDYIASNLEDPAGVQTIRDAGTQMRNYPIFRYEMVDPVVVNGDQMTATIQMSMIGLGSKPPADLYYVARDGRWVLTNESVCLIAQQARVSCSVG
ncbi:hypothetical protein [Corynebacterium provencense]|uniref:hypothetical protein n=1 Tax=Corynebacterium provencense TaxID=1737425 RepID=UPI000831B1BF|nr:hypothetical protein [Corynebacterium provencense]